MLLNGRSFAVTPAGHHDQVGGGDGDSMPRRPQFCDLGDLVLWEQIGEHLGDTDLLVDRPRSDSVVSGEYHCAQAEPVQPGDRGGRRIPAA